MVPEQPAQFVRRTGRPVLGRTLCRRLSEAEPTRQQVLLHIVDGDPAPPQPLRHRAGGVRSSKRIKDQVLLIRQEPYEELWQRGGEARGVNLDPGLLAL